MTGTVVVIPEGDGTPAVAETPAAAIAETVAIVEAVAELTAPAADTTELLRAMNDKLDLVLNRVSVIEPAISQAATEVAAVTVAAVEAVAEEVAEEIEEEEEPGEEIAPSEFTEIPAVTTEEIVTEVPEVMERVTTRRRYFV